MTATEQRTAALANANEIRAARSKLKKQLRSGQVTLSDILGDPPQAITDTPLLDVLLWTRQRRFQARGLATLGENAVRDHVNLLLPVGNASARMRAWCVEQSERRMRVPR